MEQHTAEYGQIPLAAFLANVRNITIPVEYIREDNGHWICGMARESSHEFEGGAEEMPSLTK